ncbi:run domain Beclin-1-interacting and cysteine-rich domain-containing protein isoform X2 [Prorops nasuta]|uniref:run domain Beclin-1-interacting and cysteine-rich domain-containing protein isoform X2 n=1 Tax=Prorops nasuta TaxID=863751 RepID=UPI0034CD7FEB
MYNLFMIIVVLYFLNLHITTMSEGDTHLKVCKHLLQNLKATVEGLLIDGVPNVWDVYGGLNRLHSVIENIFKHGCRIFDRNGEPDCWAFIQGLNWLQPSLTSSSTISEREDYFANIPSRITERKDLLWLYTSLEKHSLSQKLAWLLSDKEHMLSCLEPWAFLCQEDLAEAALLCLRAVERNQLILLTEIDPSLFLPDWISPKMSPKGHRRSSSFPINFSIHTEENSSICSNHESLASKVTEQRDQRVSSFEDAQDTPINNEKKDELDNNSSTMKAWNSLPVFPEDKDKDPSRGMPTVSECSYDSVQKDNNGNLSNSSFHSSRIIDADCPEFNCARTVSAINTSKDTERFHMQIKKSRGKTKCERNKRRGSKPSGSSDTLNYEDCSIRNESGKESFCLKHNHDQSRLITNNINITGKTSKKSFLAASAPEILGPWTIKIEGQKDVRTPKKSFMEDGGSSVQPMATGYFPRPAEGQSLMSFLSSGQFSRANAELDRENAHFRISEAMIAAIEQLKWNKQWQMLDENFVDERTRRSADWNRDLFRCFNDNNKTDTMHSHTAEHSVASPSSASPGTYSDSILNYESSSSISSLDDLFSSSPIEYKEYHEMESSLTDTITSAEGVALSLISKFNEDQLPRASELQWLVSEKDAPQQLLPLPKSLLIRSKDMTKDDQSQAIPLRGTMEWAPPRAQIIFTPHPAPVRRTLIAKQNYRCAGCGMSVAVKYADKFRYCEYLGRYFCTGCHTNQVALIPGKILSKWDFIRYPVSNFSYRLLDQMMMDPLLPVNYVNPLLYRRIKQLERTRVLRTQLFYLKDFIVTCRFAVSYQNLLKKQPDYIVNDPHTYSIQDLLNVKLGTLQPKLEELVELCCNHATNCEFCIARGFVCELCKCKAADIIFPWELLKVIRCESCGACFHIRCKQAFDRKGCPRCRRIQDRRISRQTEAL